MQVRAITNLEDLETVRDFWEDWQHHPNSDFDHFRLVCQMRSEVLGPYVAVVERNGRMIGLLAGRLEQTSVAPAIGYFRPVRIAATVLRVIEEGLLGEIDQEACEVLIEHVWSLLTSGEADAAIFDALRENSLLLKTLLVHRSRWWRGGKPIWSRHWEMELPEEPGFVLKGMKSKHRNELRRIDKKLVSAFSGKVSWRWLSHFDDLADLCKRIEEVASLTYQRALGAGFIDNEENGERFSLFARRGQLRTQLLEIDGKLRAFRIGVIYRSVYHGYGTGYDPELADYRVGTLVFIRMVDELVREGVRRLDFGLGDAHYKERFGDKSWSDASIRVLAPSARGLMLKTSLSLFRTINTAGRVILERAGFLDWVKKIWRRRLASDNWTSGDREVR